jgi:hypothetical protein
MVEDLAAVAVRGKDIAGGATSVNADENRVRARGAVSLVH